MNIKMIMVHQFVKNVQPVLNAQTLLLKDASHKKILSILTIALVQLEQDNSVLLALSITSIVLLQHLTVNLAHQATIVLVFM